MTSSSEMGMLRDLLAKATPGPWAVTGRLVYALNEQGTNRFSALAEGGYVWASHSRNLVSERTSEEEKLANAALIVALRNSAPALLSRIEELEDALKEAESWTIDNGTRDPRAALVNIKRIARSALAANRSGE